MSKDVKVKFKDDAFEEVIRNILSKPEGEIITVDDMKKIKKVRLEDVEVENINGIQYAVNLHTLEIVNVIVKSAKKIDLSPLKSLKNLRVLKIDGLIKIELAPILVLDLEELSLSTKNSVSLFNLTYFKNLKVLEIKSPITGELSDLSMLKKLEVLKLGLVGVYELSWLSGLSNLRKIELFYQGISDFSPLGNLKKLEEVSIVPFSSYALLPTPQSNNTKLNYTQLVNSLQITNMLDEEEKELLDVLVNNPDKKKAKEILQKSPAMVMFVWDYFDRWELIKFFIDIFSSMEVKEDYIKRFCNVEVLSLLKFGGEELDFLIEFGGEKARKYAKSFNLQRSLS